MDVASFWALLELTCVHVQLLCSAHTPSCQQLSATGGPWKFALLIRVKCVVELILQDIGVRLHHRFSLLVKIPVEEHTERDGL